MGVHMSSWDTYEEGSVLCSSGADLHSAELVCKHIGIELKRVSLVKEYWNNVFRYVHPLHKIIRKCGSTSYVGFGPKCG